MVRLAHATDIHWLATPWRRMSFKRAVGSINLYLFDRKGHFDPEVQAALVQAMMSVDADAVVISGDLTALALPEEFEAAREALDPLLTQIPTFIVPGNHDVYTYGAKRDARIQDLFGDYMMLGERGVGVFHVPGMTIVGLDPNRPHPMLASGRVPDDQLAALPDALASAPEGDAVVLALHYPILDRRGVLYDKRGHGLVNAQALIDTLERAPRRPDLVVHGHIHHGFTVDLPLSDARVPIHDPGSGGYAWMPDKDRAACFNVYELDETGLVSVERYRFGASGFQPEEGGAYATGR